LQIKASKISSACSTHVIWEIYINFSWKKSMEKNSKSRVKDNIKMDPK
jgi:hypothetical protein